MLLLPVLALPRVVPDFPPASKATVVLMGYSAKRKENYKEIVARYANWTLVDRIILIWNNPRVSPPAYAVAEASRSDTVVVVRAKHNSMMNRYVLGTELIRTSAVLTIDDDVLLSEGQLQCLLNSWEHQQQVVFGLDGRTIDSATGIYQHPDDWPRGLRHTLSAWWRGMRRGDIMLGKLMMMHVRFRSLLAAQPKSLTQSVHIGGPCARCDDIVANAVISHNTSQGAALVSDGSPLRMLYGPDGSDRTPHWHGPTGVRSNCSRWLLEYYRQHHRAVPFAPSPVAGFKPLRCRHAKT